MGYEKIGNVGPEVFLTFFMIFRDFSISLSQPTNFAILQRFSFGNPLNFTRDAANIKKSKKS